MPILYVCEQCQDDNPEGCGRPDRSDLRVAPDGRWVCDDCWIELRQGEEPAWFDLPKPPEYVPAAE